MSDQPPYEQKGKIPAPPSHREPTRPRRPAQLLVPPAPVEENAPTPTPNEDPLPPAPPEKQSVTEPAAEATTAPLATAPLAFPEGIPIDAQPSASPADAAAPPLPLPPPSPSSAEQPLQSEHETLYFERDMLPKRAAGDQTMTSTSEQSGKSDKLKCPNCGHLNRPGVLVCEKCFTLLKASATSSISTKNLGPQGQQTANPGSPDTLSAPLSTREINAVTGVGSSALKENTLLRFEIVGTTETIALRPKPQMIIGRSDPAAGVKPEIDLTPLAGYRMGVSRRHATIQMRDNKLHLHDMGSCNGTSLNGEALTPYEAYALRDGDEIRVGQLTLRLYFLEDDGPDEAKS